MHVGRFVTAGVPRLGRGKRSRSPKTRSKQGNPGDCEKVHHTAGLGVCLAWLGERRQRSAGGGGGAGRRAGRPGAAAALGHLHCSPGSWGSEAPCQETPGPGTAAQTHSHVGRAPLPPLTSPSLPLSRWESRKRNRLNREWQLRTFPDRPFQTPLRLLRKRRCRHHPNPRQLGWGVREERSGAPWEFPRLRCPPPRPHSRPAGQGPQGHDHEQEGTSTAGRGLASSAHSVTAAPHRAAGGAGAGGAAVWTPGQAPAAPASSPQQPRGPVPSGSSTAFL